MEPSSTAQQIGTTIRQARTAAGLTQAELGDFVDAGRFVIADLEAGKVTTQVRRLLDILDAVGIDIELRPRTQRLAVTPDPGGDPDVEQP